MRIPYEALEFVRSFRFMESNSKASWFGIPTLNEQIALLAHTKLIDGKKVCTYKVWLKWTVEEKCHSYRR
jgi:hypothetical protein